MPHSGSDTKHIYFVNSDPETVGKRRLKIARFDKNLEKGRLRKYSVDYFMKSKLKLFLQTQNDLMAYKNRKPGGSIFFFLLMIILQSVCMY